MPNHILLSSIPSNHEKRLVDSLKKVEQKCNKEEIADGKNLFEKKLNFIFRNLREKSRLNECRRNLNCILFTTASKKLSSAQKKKYLCTCVV